MGPLDLTKGWRGVPGWLADVEAAVLQAAVASTTGVIAELGTWCGRSFLAMASARDDRSRPMVSFDPYPDSSQAADAAAGGMNIAPADAKALARHAIVDCCAVENVHLFYVDAIEGAAAYAASNLNDLKGQRIGLLYIDDHHEGQRLIDELLAWEPLLADEAEVLIHDFFHEPYGLEAAIDSWMLSHPEWVMVETRLSMARLRRRWKVLPRLPGHAPYMVHGTPGVTVHGAPGAKRPLVSVLYNTWRLGGLDCLKVGLDRQTLDPQRFEVVLVDALYPYPGRRKAVAALFADAPYSVKHMNVTGNPFPRDAGNLARNDAIRAASGDVCVWWCDYSIAQSESLERHYSKVGHSGFRASSVGIICYGVIAVEALHSEMRAALPWRTIDDYAAFVVSLRVDSPLWATIFSEHVLELGKKQLIVTQRGDALPYELREKITRTCPLPDRALPGIEERLIWLNGTIPDTYYYAKNEATPRDVLLEINGWEESFDDGHTHDDIDIGRRLSLAKSTMVLDKGNECFVPNPRPFFPLMRWKRAPIENRRLFDTLKAMNRPRAIQGIVNELDQIPRPAPADTSLAGACT